MIICGIDASSSCTGISIFENGRLIYFNKFKPYKKIDFRNNTCQIINQVLGVVNKYSPDKIFLEDVPNYVGRSVKTVISLGFVQGVFYNELFFKRGFNVEFVPVSTWRQKFDLLKGERKRDAQKAKAIELANKTFNLSLTKSDDDIAEAILIAYSQLQF